MTSLTEKAKGKLATLTSSFDELEELFEPLFTQTLPETVIGLEPIQQAKLQTVLPYLVYDLVFIYLKSRGIDPKTHPVVAELERVKQYFNKISTAENPPPKRTGIDKGAAQRFIKHAIAQATYTKAPTEDAPGPSTTAQVQARITSKMIERQLYEKRLKEQDARDSDEDELEVFDDNEMDVDPAVSESAKNGKGKAEEVSSTKDESTLRSNKRRRPAVDPFAGYGDDVPASVPVTVSPTPDIRHVDDTAPDSASMPGAESSSGSAKKAKKTKKKSKKSST